MYLGRLLDDRLCMCGICLGVGDALLLVAACLVLGGDLLAQFALARRGGSFRRLQLVARGISSVVTAWCARLASAMGA